MVSTAADSGSQRTLPSSWQQQAAGAVTDAAELLGQLGLPNSLLAAARNATRLFPLRVPHSFIRRIRYGDPDDPLLRQVLPLHLELKSNPEYSLDPVGDRHSMPINGVLHKYRRRVLLVTTGACAIHCRYCFRRHFPYSTANPGRKQWQSALDYIGRDTTIHEVILSGGDPLSLSDRRLAVLCQHLDEIPHLRRIRFHTRLPIVIPVRIDAALLEWLSGLGKEVVFVVHSNHANELDREVTTAVGHLRKLGITVFNQAVLLRGVNDNAGALSALSEGLFAAGIVPYYLHMLDRVQGAAHFEVSERRAQQLYHQLQRTLPGYLVPRLVREVPGAPSKIALL